MLVPLFGFMQGDTVGLLVLVHDHDKVADIATSLGQAATVRVAPAARASVWFAGRMLDPESTVAEAGLTALDRIDVRVDERVDMRVDGPAADHETGVQETE